MKYKVGDKVRIKDDLQFDTNYGGLYITSKMRDLKGQVVTITEIITDAYRINRDNNIYLWTDEMLEPAD